jgi:cytochrome P450 family 9
MFLLSDFLVPLFGTNLTIWLALFAVATVYLYRSVRKKQSYWQDRGVKCKKPTFLFGSMSVVRDKSFAEKIVDVYNEFPGERYHGMYQFVLPTLLIKDPDLMKQVTVKEFDHFVNHRQIADAAADPFWNKNLFASRDERWRDMRSTLSPSFTSNKMRIMYKLIEECALQFVEYFQNQSEDVVELQMKDAFTRYTNDVIATTAFGVKCDSLKDKTNKFYMMGKDASDLGGWKILKFFAYGLSPTLARLFRVKVISPAVSNYFSKIIEETVQARKEKHIVRPDMIHLLLEAQKGRQHLDEEIKVSEGFSSVSESEVTKNRRKQEITLEDITAQAFVFFLAGFKTVSTLLTFAFYELAINQDVQNRLREEIQSVSEELTYEALLGMKYLDMVVSETLRKWPASVLTDREVSKEFTIQPTKPGEKPLFLEKGIVCLLPIFAIHRDPRFYPEPEKFDPERFNNENKHKINPTMYMPFGAGPRNCIGSRFALLEAKLIMFHLLKKFQVVTVGKTPVPLVLDKVQINLDAEGGMWLGLKKIT